MSVTRAHVPTVVHAMTWLVCTTVRVYLDTLEKNVKLVSMVTLSPYTHNYASHISN